MEKCIHVLGSMCRALRPIGGGTPLDCDGYKAGCKVYRAPKSNESTEKADNTARDAIALCRRAVAHADLGVDIPFGHPMIEEMRAVVAQQHP